MYKQVDTAPSVMMDNGESAEPLITLQDEYGGRSHIVVDDHCYVIVNEHEGVGKWTTHIFAEWLPFLKALPPPGSYYKPLRVVR